MASWTCRFCNRHNDPDTSSCATCSAARGRKPKPRKPPSAEAMRTQAEKDMIRSSARQHSPPPPSKPRTDSVKDRTKERRGNLWEDAVDPAEGKPAEDDFFAFFESIVGACTGFFNTTEETTQATWLIHGAAAEQPSMDPPASQSPRDLRAPASSPSKPTKSAFSPSKSKKVLCADRQRGLERVISRKVAFAEDYSSGARADGATADDEAATQAASQFEVEEEDEETPEEQSRAAVEYNKSEVKTRRRRKSLAAFTLSRVSEGHSSHDMSGITSTRTLERLHDETLGDSKTAADEEEELEVKTEEEFLAEFISIAKTSGYPISRCTHKGKLVPRVLKLSETAEIIHWSSHQKLTPQKSSMKLKDIVEVASNRWNVGRTPWQAEKRQRCVTVATKTKALDFMVESTDEAETLVAGLKAVITQQTGHQL